MTDITSKVSELLPLEELHLPEPPGFWPVAWGWWSLVLAIFPFYSAYLIVLEMA